MMRTLPSNSFDALVTDPPAGISFMQSSKDGWDSDKGGRTNWIWWLGCVMREVHRVLKPGAHGFVWALPRTSHWTAMALEDAGFEIRDRVVHVFGSGFPKSLDVSKAIDKAAGVDRKVVGTKRGTKKVGSTIDGSTPWSVGAVQTGIDVPVTEAATASARQWQGWGTALKPAMEDWWLVRKTLVGTVVENVQKHGTGALNIDGIRAGTSGGTAGRDYEKTGLFGLGGKAEIKSIDAGRWPANFVLTHSADCKANAVSRKARGTRADKRDASASIGKFSGEAVPQFSYGGGEVDVSGCAGDCPVRLLREQGGSPEFFNVFDADPDVAKFDPFFYVPKPSRSEKEANLGAIAPAVAQGVGALRDGGRGGKVTACTHPTVKPVALMRHLVRLVTPPGGRVLDPFGGSGTTGVACLRENVDALLIEKDEKFVQIIRGRCGLIG